MDSARIGELLRPFLSAPLSPLQLEQISIYIDLLLRWNSRINLTAIRSPEEIVTRHFGESFFAARQLLPDRQPGQDPASLAHSQPVSSAVFAPQNEIPPLPTKAIDLGSGAGFPGIPLKIWSPAIPITLIESNHKKVAFLREVIRALTLTAIDVFFGRAEDYPAASTQLVTLRAVERFTTVLPTAARLVAPGGRLALLIGQAQVDQAQALLPFLDWRARRPIPQSASRVLVSAQVPNE
jgi:16S rRNA (guanine527-N7)-methyltransferase